MNKRETMTIDMFLKKYNKCPFCESYAMQGELCRGCENYIIKGEGIDKFRPKQEWINRMNKEVTE